MTAILSLFLAAFILAYVLEPIAERLHRLGAGRAALSGGPGVPGWPYLSIQ